MQLRSLCGYTDRIMSAKSARKRDPRKIGADVYLNDAELSEIDEAAAYELRTRSDFLRVAALERARAARKAVRP